MYVADDQPILAVVRGDDDFNNAKLQSATGATFVRAAEPEEIPPLITGANEDGFHLAGVDVQRDILAHGARLADLRSVRHGEACPRCDAPLEMFKALEVGRGGRAAPRSRRHHLAGVHRSVRRHGLIGIPIRVAVGKRSLAVQRAVEWKLRRDTGPAEMVPLDQLTSRTAAFLAD